MIRAVIESEQSGEIWRGKERKVREEFGGKGANVAAGLWGTMYEYGMNMKCKYGL